MSKLSFDGATKTITVLAGVTTLNIRADLYTEWVDWAALNPNWPLAMRYSGLDPIPGGESGGIFFLKNGWKLVIDFTQTMVLGVLYSDDYATAYWNSLGSPLYPATVSALVNTVNTGVPITTAADPNEVASAVWNKPLSELTTAGTIGEYLSKKLLTVAKFLGLR